MAGTLDRAAELLLGEEGAVATEAEMRVVMVSAAISVAGVMVISPIVSSLAGPLSVTPAKAGQLIAAFTAPSILLTPVTGVLADRMGRKPVLVGGLVLFGLAGGAIALVADYRMVLALRVLQGAGYAGTIPLTVTIIGDLYDGAREATAQGLRVTSIQLVSLGAPLVASVLVARSWRLPFLLFLPALAIAAWAWVTLPTAHTPAETTLSAYVRELLGALREPGTTLVVATFAVRFFLTFGYLTYVSVLLATRFGASTLLSGLAVSGWGLTSLLATTQSGRVTARVDGRLVLVVGFVGAALGLAVMSFGLAGFAVGLLAFGLGTGITGPVQKSILTQLAPPDLRGGAVSAGVIAQAVGQTLGPVVMGAALATGDPGSVFVVLGLAGGGLGAVVSLLAHRYGDR
ncbi:MAG: MFS transporter [Haloarculaceae archaeon]